jgi:hypothetical protein
MRLNVLPADIGQDGVVAMTFRVQNEGSLSTMACFAKQARAQVEPQLHRHVESRQAAGADRDARKIVDAPVALPIIAAILLTRTSGPSVLSSAQRG